MVQDAGGPNQTLMSPYSSSSNNKVGVLLAANARNGSSDLKEAASAANSNAPQWGWIPPDGGARAWLVMIGSFFCNGILFGVINSYSVLYADLHDRLVLRNVTNPSGKAALVGSLAMGTTFFMSPISGLLTDMVGIRLTTFLGGAIASCGMLLSSFFVDNIVALCVTFGVMYGFGGALAYTPSLAILGHYFKRYLGVVNGVVTAGSAAFTIVMPYLIDAVLHHWGIEWALRFLGLIAAAIMLISFVFKPIRQETAHRKPTTTLRTVFNTAVWHNRRYVIWTLVIAGSLFGYFVPYVYMKKFVESSFPPAVDSKLPVLCIGITSGVGRLLFGYIADRKNANRILLQQISFFSIGVLTMLLPVTAGHFPWLIAISLGMGLFDGCFISLLGPIAFDICGQDGATQAIGYLLGICSIPLTIGPYVAGVIYEQQRSYRLPLILAGIPPTVGAFLMLLTRLSSSANQRSTIGEKVANGGGPLMNHNSHSTDLPINDSINGKKDGNA